MKTKMLKASSWIDQSKMGDPMIGRVVILAWLDDNDKTFKISTHEEWFEGTPEQAKEVLKPNYAYGHYFDNDISINMPILADFYQRSSNLFSVFRDK